MSDPKLRAEIGDLVAGNTAALATLALLLIENKVIDKDDLVKSLSDAQAQHRTSSANQLSLSSIKHLLSILT